VAASAASAEPPSEPRWWERSHLTGDWGGRRTALIDHGVVPGARYTAGFWSNVRGGFQTGTRYEGFAQWWIEADLDALLGWKGGSFDINWYSYHGGQPSLDLVGPFPTQTGSGWETSVSVRFYEIFLRQTWGDGRFAFKVGQLAADTDFFVSRNADVLLNGTFGFLGLGRGTEIAPFYPLAAPGAYFRARTADARWEAHVGVYTADPGVDESSNFGFDWSFDNGAFFIGEICSRRSPFGRAGSYVVGAVGTTAQLEDFASGGSANGGYGLFASIDQLLVEQTPTRPGLGIFARSYGAPQADRGLALWYVGFGLKLTRPFGGRDQDVFSLGFAHLRLSDDYVASLRAEGVNVSQRESVLELTYRLQVTGWLTLQPDVQFFFDPHFSRRDAMVIGLRAVIEL
jgi:porin